MSDSNSFVIFFPVSSIRRLEQWNKYSFYFEYMICFYVVLAYLSINSIENCIIIKRCEFKRLHIQMVSWILYEIASYCLRNTAAVYIFLFSDINLWPRQVAKINTFVLFWDIQSRKALSHFTLIRFFLFKWN